MKPLRTSGQSSIVIGYELRWSNDSWLFYIAGEVVGPFVSRDIEFEMPRTVETRHCLEDCLRAMMGVRPRRLPWDGLTTDSLRMTPAIGVPTFPQQQTESWWRRAFG